jgi:predicted enzyme related to lactoylglutathione lyase
MIQPVWIELPVKDITRALQFYKTVFQLGDIEIADDGTRKTATLVSTGEGGSPGISLTQVAGFNPSDKSGVWLYLSGGDDFEGHAERIKQAGGTLVDEKVSMGEAGSYTSFLDTEGNLLALYTYP